MWIEELSSIFCFMGWVNERDRPGMTESWHEPASFSLDVAHVTYPSVGILTTLRNFDSWLVMTLDFIVDKDAYTSYPDTSNDEVRRNQDPVEERRDPIAPRRFEQREITRRHSDDLVTDEGASSTLFVGNLSGNVRYKDLMSLFKRYGDIEASYK